MSTFDFTKLQEVTVVLRADDCPACGGAGSWPIAELWSDDETESCHDCLGTGVRHCSHGVPRRGCQEPGCAVEEVMSA